MNRIAHTLQLARESWNVLRADKELLLLPVLSMITTVIVALSFVLPLWSTVLPENGGLESGSAPSTLAWVLMLLAYLVLAYITIFFNAALVHAANERMNGGDPTVGSALRGALGRAAAILPWALVSATVSIILQAIRERAGILGQIAAGIAGLAWSLVTYLVLPILVVEGIGVGDAIKRSAALFKRTWGENVAAQVGFGLLGFVAALPSVLIVAAGAGLGGAGLYGAVVVAVLWALTVAVVVAALSVIFQTALYRYAAQGSAGDFFSDGAMSRAFASRN